MGVAPACQRTRAYATFAVLFQTRKTTRVPRMDFGLLPEFSTPVQKPVENGVLWRTQLENRRVYGCFLKAKVLRARFKATLGVPPKLQTQAAVWR